MKGKTYSENSVEQPFYVFPGYEYFPAQLTNEAAHFAIATLETGKNKAMPTLLSFDPAVGELVPA